MELAMDHGQASIAHSVDVGFRLGDGSAQSLNPWDLVGYGDGDVGATCLPASDVQFC